MEVILGFTSIRSIFLANRTRLSDTQQDTTRAYDKHHSAQAQMLRFCPACRLSKVGISPRLSRSAHAAAAQQETPRSTEPIRPFTPNPHVLNKGKGREREKDSDYRFPERGSSGGLPDPFEVLGLDRTASHEDVKRQCESCFYVS